ncbi:Aste57867_2805 [Aphanomyces stellatus]|uniref:Aste57867_2805 protein n=1 Tax=Aphanomyces stellatus TaxID=120398 RepID=A0A485KCM0_9STRA|nr:hypothetical protein As57867_002798 [Aphanomyces stellatus]VFT79994.1 Aste57867_2805 [Aphanomyces stellatus]
MEQTADEVAPPSFNFANGVAHARRDSDTASIFANKWVRHFRFDDRPDMTAGPISTPPMPLPRRAKTAFVRSNTSTGYQDFNKATTVPPLARQHSMQPVGHGLKPPLGKPIKTTPSTSSTAVHDTTTTTTDDVVVDKDFAAILDRIRQCVATIQGIRTEFDRLLPPTTTKGPI